MQNPFPVYHSPHVCNKKIKHTDLCYFHLQLTWLDWSRSRPRSRTLWSWPWSPYVLVSLTSLTVRKSDYLNHTLAECFKDDNASQWKSGNFDPRYPPPLKIAEPIDTKFVWVVVSGTSTPVQNFITIQLPLIAPLRYAKIRIKWLG